jgi:serine/threonine protein kinase
LDVERKTLVVYSRQYQNGDLLAYTTNHTLDRSAKMRLLWGAWVGLYQLHTNLNLIHGDVSPGNIFVNDAGEGVIGDLESAMLLKAGEGLRKCEPAYHFWGSSCFGAPFAQCDIRRDQVALLLTSVALMADEPWFEYCWSVMPKWPVTPDGDMSVYGFQGSNGKIRMDGDMYRRYGKTIRKGGAAAEVDPVLVIMLELLDTLADIADQKVAESRWDATIVHNRLLSVLSTKETPTG